MSASAVRTREGKHRCCASATAIPPTASRPSEQRIQINLPAIADDLLEIESQCFQNKFRHRPDLLPHKVLAVPRNYETAELGHPAILRFRSLSEYSGPDFWGAKILPHGAVQDFCRIVAADRAQEIVVPAPGFYRGQSCDSGNLGRGRHDSPRNGVDLRSGCSRRRIAGPCAADRIRIESRARRIEPTVASCRRRRWSDCVPEDIASTSRASATVARGAGTRQGWPCGPIVHCGFRSALIATWMACHEPPAGFDSSRVFASFSMEPMLPLCRSSGGSAVRE
jgi:hypothetical protein